MSIKNKIKILGLSRGTKKCFTFFVSLRDIFNHKKNLEFTTKAKPRLKPKNSFYELKLPKLLILILLVGFLLRIYNLSSESVSFDEINTLRFTEHPNSDYGNPPLYYLFLDYWTKLFRKSEFAIRFPSVIFGALSALALYCLADLLFNKKIALLSALILAINPFHIYLSQQARMYSLFTLFSLLSLYYFFKILRDKKRINWQFYLIFSLLNLFTHYFAIFVLFIEILYFVLFYKNFKLKLKYFILTNLAVLALFSPQFFKIYIGFLSKTIDFNWGLRQTEYFTSIFNSFLGWNLIYAFILLGLFLYGLLKVDKRKRIFGIIYLFFPIFSGFLLSYNMPIIPRYFIFILPIYIIFISKGLINFKNKWIQALLILGIISISGFKLSEDYLKPNYAQWRELIEYIESNSQENDIILFDAGYKQPPFEYYYEGNLTIIDSLSGVNFAEDKRPYNDLKTTLKKAGRVWLILSDDFRSGEYYTHRLEQDFSLIISKKFFRVEVFLYEKINRNKQ